MWGTGERRKYRPIENVDLMEMEARVTQRVREETIQEMNAQMDVMVKEKFITFAKELGLSIPSHMTGDVRVPSSCQSGGVDPFANIQVYKIICFF